MIIALLLIIIVLQVVSFIAARKHRNTAETTTMVAGGDLSRRITAVRGEILELKNTINVMVDELKSFAAEVTRIGGTWRDINANLKTRPTREKQDVEEPVPQDPCEPLTLLLLAADHSLRHEVHVNNREHAPNVYEYGERTYLLSRSSESIHEYVEVD